MRTPVDLAVIIPTLNEEHFIGELLDSIANQNILPKEIVVIDAYSEDKTIQEIKKRQSRLSQLKYFRIKRSTVSRQRNFGAAKTQSSHLLFLDADTVLKGDNVLKAYFQEVLNKKPDVAAAFNLPLSDYWKDKVFFWLMNTTFKLSKPIWPMATGMNLYVTRGTFNKLKGFDENIKVGEDHDLVQRAAKLKLRFIFLKSINVYTSVRRFVKKGRRKYVFEIAKASYKVLRYGHKHNPIEYEFGNFKNDRIYN